jgi:hypothetical protein
MNSRSRKSLARSRRGRDLGYHADRLMTSAGILFSLMFAIFVIGAGFYFLVDLAMTLDS